MDFSTIPTFGWVCLLIFGLAVCAIIFILLFILSKKNIKSKILEVTEIKPEIKERYIAEGKDLVDNQSQVAKMMLKMARIRIYEEGLKLFNITDQQEKNILELITYRIADRINYELKNDFTRNHIISKSNYELELYSNAKSKGYYTLVREKLYMHNNRLPNYDLPKIMTKISFEEANKLFTDIYFSARAIAGQERKNGSGTTNNINH